MGCDIHVYVEKRVKGRWVCVAINPPKAEGRNYKLFAALAGVRGDGPEPRGLPEDLSETVEYMAASDSADSHSHSWLPVEAAILVWTRYNEDIAEFSNDFIPYHIFGLDDLKNLRIVFWFDS